ncbi:hypothetical protein AAEX28_07405 [Lentisphaerota bacterium WC36G]|nr:hypothetical protein LJT99_10265 [Lentisphaerae bacterium WC36]
MLEFSWGKKIKFILVIFVITFQSISSFAVWSWTCTSGEYKDYIVNEIYQLAPNHTIEITGEYGFDAWSDPWFFGIGAYIGSVGKGGEKKFIKVIETINYTDDNGTPVVEKIFYKFYRSTAIYHTEKIEDGIKYIETHIGRYAIGWLNEFGMCQQTMPAPSTWYIEVQEDTNYQNKYIPIDLSEYTNRSRITSFSFINDLYWLKRIQGTGPVY